MESFRKSTREFTTGILELPDLGLYQNRLNFWAIEIEAEDLGVPDEEDDADTAE